MLVYVVACFCEKLYRCIINARNRQREFYELFDYSKHEDGENWILKILYFRQYYENIWSRFVYSLLAADGI
jgi:hypothetical protein